MDQQIKAILNKLEPIRSKLLKEYYDKLEYQELVMTMGVTDWEWETLQKGFDDFMLRAEGYLKHGLQEDAIAELKAAQLIKPNDLEMHRCFSQAYLQFFKNSHDEMYATLSRQHAKICLQINSKHDLALKILAQLEQKYPPPFSAQNAIFRIGNAPLREIKKSKKLDSHNNQHQTTARNKTKILWILLGGLVLLVAVIVYGTGNRTYKEKKKNSMEIPPISEEVELEVEFDLKGHDNIKIEVQKSVFKPPTGQSDFYKTYYTLKGYYVVDGEEIEHLKFVYDLYEEDKIVHTGETYMQFPKGAQPKDKISFFTTYLDQKNKYNLTKAVFRVNKFKARAAKASYSEAPEVETIWRLNQTDKVNLVFKERHSEIKYNSISKDVLHAFTFLIENQGTTNIEGIKGKINWYNSSGELVGAETVNLWSSTNPFIKAGDKVLTDQKVLSLGVGNKNVPVAKYTFEILEIQY